VNNYLHVSVRSTIGIPLEGASVTLTRDAVPGMIGYTRQDGWLKWNVVRYETFIAMNRTFPVLSLDINLDGYNITDSPRDINMSVTHTEDFTGQQFDEPPDGNGDGIDPFLMMIIGVVGGIIAAIAILLFILARRRKKKVEKPEDTSSPRTVLEEASRGSSRRWIMGQLDSASLERIPRTSRRTMIWRKPMFCGSAGTSKRADSCPPIWA
jgi:hypothetical protein